MLLFPFLLGSGCIHRLPPCPDGDDCASTTDSGDSGTTPVVSINDDFALLRSRPKNVILFSVDTLRRDHVNLLGYTAHEQTPTIDQLLANGVDLYDHRSCSSWTLPSFGSRSISNRSALSKAKRCHS